MLLCISEISLSYFPSLWDSDDMAKFPSNSKRRSTLSGKATSAHKFDLSLRSNIDSIVSGASMDLSRSSNVYLLYVYQISAIARLSPVNLDGG